MKESQNTAGIKKQIALYKQRTEMPERQKRYRTLGFVMFLVAVGLLALRIFVYYLPISENLAWLLDLIFTLLMQGGILVLMPVLIYKYALRMNVRQMLEFSNVKRVKWYYVALAVPLGLCVYCVTILVSSVWQQIISSFGYVHSSSSLPETFSPALMVLDIVLIGVLPAVCEEFCNRGGFLTTMRKSFSLPLTIIICGVAFGLFHQNITQVFYTALFGALAAFLTLRLKSVLPAMVMHFVNNTFSVINDYCYTYGFFGGGFSRALEWGLEYRTALVMCAFLVVSLVGVGIVMLTMHLTSAKVLGKKKDVILDSGFDHTNNRVVLMGEEDKQKVIELGLDKEVYGKKQKEDLYKPSLRDNAFYIGAVVATACATLFTFIFGLLR